MVHMPATHSGAVQFKSSAVGKVLRDNGIRTRYQLSKNVAMAKATIYTIFDENWCGPLHDEMLRQIVERFNVNPRRLIERRPTVKNPRPANGEECRP